MSRPVHAPHRTVVLVVEDEPLLRMHAVGILEDADFEVLDAPNADVAIAILEARADITVVFTDIEMPGSMDGLKLASAIRGRWPPIELIVTSGRYSIDETDLPERGRFIGKPYSEQSVVAAIRQFQL